jgi:UDP-glucose 4-epimerase
MRVLVTGATGFLGSHLVERLAGESSAIAVLLRSTSDTWRINPWLLSIERLYGDLTNLDACEEEIARYKPDTIFHLGWHGVGNSQRDSAGQLDANLAATVRLADLAGRIGCRTFVGIGSQAEYGPQNRRLDEAASTLPTTMYGVAKLAAYHACRVRLASSAVRFAWIRIFSTYGPKDNTGWLIPSFIESLLSGRCMQLTAGEQRWDFNYAGDAARAIQLVGANEHAEGVFNLGAGKCVPLRHVLKLIRDRIDPSLPLRFGEIPYRRDQVMHLEANTSRLSATTGWQPEVDLDEGVSQTIGWHLATRHCAKSKGVLQPQDGHNRNATGYAKLASEPKGEVICRH